MCAQKAADRATVVYN